MSVKIGIPRALFYFQYYPFWKSFFEELGAEVIISSPTNKKILDAGVKACVDEACLPVKLFHGHVMDLTGKVDYIFIPKYTSVSRKEYVCPKFGGLPDMIRNTIPDMPPIIDTEINLWKSDRNALKAAFEIGLRFTGSHSLIRKAFRTSIKCYIKHRNNIEAGLLPGYLTHSENSQTTPLNTEGDLKVAIISHTYNLYDSFINMDMLRKLRSNGVNLITNDMLSTDIINEKAAMLHKRIFWFFGKRAVGTALHIADRKDIDGVIYLMSFGCGVDAFMSDLAGRRIKQAGSIPFIVLTLDEHSGEAGMDTRLEAFIDMIRLKRQKKVSYGG